MRANCKKQLVEQSQLLAQLQGQSLQREGLPPAGQLGQKEQQNHGRGGTPANLLRGRGHEDVHPSLDFHLKLGKLKGSGGYK